jgi:hypothetical protein
MCTRTRYPDRHPDYDQGDDDNKQLVVLPPKFFAKAFAHVAGCSKCDPNSPDWYDCMGINVDTHTPGYQSVQNMV